MKKNPSTSKKKPDLNITIDIDSRRNTTQYNCYLDELKFTPEINQHEILSKILPSYTPKESINSLLDKTRPQTTRSIMTPYNKVKTKNLFEKENFFGANNINGNNQSYLNIPMTDINYYSNYDNGREENYHPSSKSPKNHLAMKENIIDTSFEQRNFFLKITSDRRCLEEEYQFMENRVNHLAKASDKIKQKIHMTKKKTEDIIKNKDRLLNDLELNEKMKKELQRDLILKKEKAMKLKIDMKDKKIEKEQKLVSDKIQKVNEVKNTKQNDQKLRLLIKKEEEIKNNEKIWKISMQEKKLENSILFKQIQTRTVAKKRIEAKYNEDKVKVDEISNKLKELEKLEQQLLDNLKITHNCHVSTYNEMQKVFHQKPYSASPIRIDQGKCINRNENKSPNDVSFRSNKNAHSNVNLHNHTNPLLVLHKNGNAEIFTNSQKKSNKTFKESKL